MLSIDRGLSSAPAALQAGAAADAGASDRDPATFGDLFLQAIDGPGLGALTDGNADASGIAPGRFPRGAADESTDPAAIVQEPAADEGQQLLAFLVAPDSTPSIASAPWPAPEASSAISFVPVVASDAQALPPDGIDAGPPEATPTRLPRWGPRQGGPHVRLGQPLVEAALDSFDIEQPLPAPEDRAATVAHGRYAFDSALQNCAWGPPSGGPGPAAAGPHAILRRALQEGDAPDSTPDTSATSAAAGHAIVGSEGLQRPSPTDHDARAVAIDVETRAMPQEHRVDHELAGARRAAALVNMVASDEATRLVAPALSSGAAGESPGLSAETPFADAELAAASPINPHLLSRVATQAGAALDAFQAPTLSGPALGQTPAAATPPAADDVIGPQIVRSLRLVAQDGGGEARVRLKPEYLGEVLILLKVDQGGVTASLQAESPAVRHWAETHEHVLRQGLGAHGLRLDQFTVQDTTEASTSERRSHDGQANQQDRQPPPRKARPDAKRETERFEVVL